ncbi:uncharacterized protein LOC121998141 [Zingiber officinale]|uniref:uncharacterized protein LOC121998141 n=1 Tax=Zingiber officinale TaxID=94328 RepID=UPI001C4AAA9A|nr:uncharacterized protein LOC121998141 [Zingiber officinale]
MNKSLDEAEEIIENVALNRHQWASERFSGAFSGNQMKASGKFEVDAFTLMSTKLNALTKKFEAMGSNTANAIVCACDICGSADHAQDTCPLGPMQAQINQLEQCDAITGYNQRNHPNFSYRNNQDQGPTHQTYQHGQQAHQQQQSTQLSRIEKMLEEALSEHKEMRSEIKQLTQRLENSEKHQKMQDSQIAQIAQSVSRAQGTFPGKPDLNRVEHCNHIELRSRRTVGNPQIITQMEVDSEKEPTLLMPNQTQNRDGEEGTKKIGEACQTTPQNQMISFPQKLIASQKDEEFHRFLKKVKEICIEVPLLDALHQMPKFAKFLKGILSNRRQKCDFETIALIEGCSTLFWRILHQNFRIQEVSPYRAKLALNSYREPSAIWVEDVPVEVGGCVIPTDFIIMDMKEDLKIPIILGRPFLATAGALIDVKNHKLSLEIGKERIEFDLSNPSNYVSSSQGNPSEIDARGVEERTFREFPSRGRQEIYMSCAIKAKGANWNTNHRRRAMLPWV